MRAYEELDRAIEERRKQQQEARRRMVAKHWALIVRNVKKAQEVQRIR